MKAWGKAGNRAHAWEGQTLKAGLYFKTSPCQPPQTSFQPPSPLSPVSLAPPLPFAMPVCLPHFTHTYKISTLSLPMAWEAFCTLNASLLRKRKSPFEDLSTPHTHPPAPWVEEGRDTYPSYFGRKGEDGRQGWAGSDGE